jgi:hypothetical protein
VKNSDDSPHPPASAQDHTLGISATRGIPKTFQPPRIMISGNPTAVDSDSAVPASGKPQPSGLALDAKRSLQLKDGQIISSETRLNTRSNIILR